MEFSVHEIMEEFFKYDEDLPLEATESAVEASSGKYAEYHVTFMGVHDQRVSALLTLPSHASPPFPAVLILHGVFGHKNSFNQQKRSARLVTGGYATLRIDGQYCGDRQVQSADGISLQTQYYYRNLDAMAQTAIDLMRGVDYLASRDDIEGGRIGFAGFSMGGAIGTIFVAHDLRVKAAVLGLTGGDFGKLNVSAPDAGMAERMLRAYRIVDPILYVARICPRPILMLNAAHDIIVTRASTEALFEAAGEPKRIIWYECSHAELPDEALEDMTRFFDEELGK